jgi:hypothetical protein
VLVLVPIALRNLLNIVPEPSVALLKTPISCQEKFTSVVGTVIWNVMTLEVMVGKPASIPYGPDIRKYGIDAGFLKLLVARIGKNMPRMLDPAQFVLVAIAGWMNQCQQQTIEYLREENRVLREQLGNRWNALH